MDEAQFQLAIEELAQKFQTLKHTAQLKDCDWQDVTLIRSQNLPSSLNHFLRLTRRLSVCSKRLKKPPDTTPQQHQVPQTQQAQSQSINDEQASDKQEEEEEDPECLPKFPPTTTHPSTDPTTTITYDIIYSPTYRVPILYIHKPPPPPITLPHDDNNDDDDDDNDNDNPDPFLTNIQNSSSSSAVLLSLIDHPTTGKPVYFIHPCRTQEAIAEILSSSSSSTTTRRLGKNGNGGGEEEEEEERGGGERGMQWFMAWWGCIGNSAGLSVPMELARMVMMPTLTTTKTTSTAGGE